MAFDGTVLAAVTKELQNLIGGRIEKIYQPETNCILLHIHNHQEKCKLLMSTHAINGRVQLTRLNYNNPFKPPLFCMILRKHLEGGKIISIEQGQDLERTLTISIEVYNETGDRKLKQLILEIMGKHSNLILIDLEKYVIVDGIKRYSHQVSRYREILPGRAYVTPPVQNKLSLLTLTEEQFKAILYKSSLNSPIYKLIVKNINGISTPLAKELTLAAGLSLELTLNEVGEYEFSRLWQQIMDLATTVHTANYKPTVYFANEEPLDFTAVPFIYSMQANEQTFSSMSQALDYFFGKKLALEQLKKHKHTITKVLTKELERNYKKRVLQEETVIQAKKAEPYRIMGELLTANIYKIKKGDGEIIVENFYDSNNLLTIPLERNLTPAQNAQSYFRKYNKAKISAEGASKQLLLTNEEINYLESVLQSVTQADSLQEVEEIKQELIKEKYIKLPIIKKAKPQREIQTKPQLLSFLSSAGFPILVGKNNKQNDLLTVKIAKDHDLWFHVKNIPGSHVIVQTNGQKIPDSTLEEAALLAAYYSKGQTSSQVPVDWTLKKHVKKPGGARPGQVIYENYKTIYITPEKAALDSLKKVEQKG